MGLLLQYFWILLTLWSLSSAEIDYSNTVEDEITDIFDLLDGVHNNDTDGQIEVKEMNEFIDDENQHERDSIRDIFETLENENSPSHFVKSISEMRIFNITDHTRPEVAGEGFDFASTRKDAQKNIEYFLERGSENAERIVKLRELSNKMRTKSSSGRPLVSSFHSRRLAEPEFKLRADCRAQVYLEASKLIVEKYKIPVDKRANFIESLKIPASFYNKMNQKCKRNGLRMSDPPLNCKDPVNVKYRTSTGECNNKDNQNLGKTGERNQRKLNPVYADGMGLPRGYPDMPNVRLISSKLSAIPPPTHSNKITQMLKAWGQFLDHDITATPETEIHGCCETGRETPGHSGDCHMIDVSKDAYYQRNNVKCLPFKRSVPYSEDNRMGPREQFNQVTSYVDASNVYGSSVETARNLRTFHKGGLKEGKIGELGSCTVNKPCVYAFLPHTKYVEGDDAEENPQTPYTAGDFRVNEQPGLTAMHTIFVRYHNQMAYKIASLRPDLDDETIYQSVRRVIGALMQHITYTEFLPAVFGKYHYRKSKVYTPATLTSYETYDKSMNPNIFNVFATAAYRFGHTLITDQMLGKVSFSLANNFMNSVMVTESNTYPSYILAGECKTPAEQSDALLASTLTDKLFTSPSRQDVGFDLMSFNIQRGRDHGLPGYNAWRQLYTGKKFSSFKDLRDSGEMPAAVVDVFESTYKDIDDVDLFPAGLAEKKVYQGLVGKTFLSILEDQFVLLKLADRFWYENRDAGFSRTELYYLKKATLSSVICDTTSIKSIQKYVMLTGDHPRNRPLPCAEIQRYYSLLDDKEIYAFARAI